MTAKRSLVSRLAAGFAAAGLLAQPSLAVPAESAPTGDVGIVLPTDPMERGLWLQVDEAERKMRTSPTIIQDPALNAYVRSVLCKTVTEAKCKGVRIYLMRTADFNANMAPNGMMQIWSGLLLRTQNEAQLASVLGHEFTHYEKRHSLQLYRDIKAKTDAAAFLNMIPYAGIISLGLLTSIFTFSREMEREADTGGVANLAAAGYDTREAAKIWERLRAEMDAAAAERKTKSRKDKNGGLFATHPPTAERVTYLTEQAAKLPGVAGSTGAEAYRAALAAWWPQFLEDQLKRNDYGATQYLLNGLASDGQTPWLLYAQGELHRRRAAEGDLAKAATAYGQAIEAGGDLPELWRGRGLVELKQGQADAARADLNEYLRRAPEASDRAMIAMLAGGGQ